MTFHDFLVSIFMNRKVITVRNIFLHNLMFLPVRCPRRLTQRLKCVQSYTKLILARHLKKKIYLLEDKTPLKVTDLSDLFYIQRILRCCLFLENSWYLIVLFIDFSKAIFNLDHDKLHWKSYRWFMCIGDYVPTNLILHKELSLLRTLVAR